MNATWMILAGLTVASLLTARFETGLVAACVVLALTWLKLRLVLVHFVGVGGGWRTGLSVLFAIFLAVLLLPYALKYPYFQ